MHDPNEESLKRVISEVLVFLSRVEDGDISTKEAARHRLSLQMSAERYFGKV